ncbi:OLC1v1012002C1 [Oldenlandia corymbosa var. corymbosa]|uniref:OLC1v1012002C1 n=1 Tax=Oldenlandia corymbosa var. corymbosa TaxID=529605 RepID=A0AAV1DXD6_OLDCO|nr:OLC1v1012002C1 [Oldenlandia corymbosa var. corymbosa]
MDRPSLRASQSAFFNDDEYLDHQSSSPDQRNSKNEAVGTLQVNSYTEVSAISRFHAPDNFTILINLKAPPPPTSPNMDDPTQVPQSSRVPIDLVTVLDVSYSIEGRKIALLKQAMDFFIQNLGPNDRLSVIIFSHNCRRLFPLRRMSESGRLQALGTANVSRIVNGAKITRGNSYSNSRIPVHTFGFGRDHDASLMHSIAEMSRGTFSFIETERVIQDAFAQCIGGLLSVVVKELQVNIERSFLNQVTPDGRMGNIDVGDLYAEEEKDFVVTVKVPAEEISSSELETALLKVRCVNNDPLTKELMTVRSEEVRIRRPEEVNRQEDVCVEVDRQQNRLLAMEAMELARAAAEKGDLSAAESILEKCLKKLSESVSAKSHDFLCLGLEAELKEIKQKLPSRDVYEASGRAYMRSGLSSHAWQKPTGACLSRESGDADSGYEDMGFSLYEDDDEKNYVCAAADHDKDIFKSSYSGAAGSRRHAYQTPTINRMVARSRAATRRNNKGKSTPAKALGTIDESKDSSSRGSDRPGYRS